MPRVDLKEVRPDGWVSLTTTEVSRVPCIGEHVKVDDAYFEIVAVIHEGDRANVLVRRTLIEDLTSDVKRRAKAGRVEG